jgi:His-Xaa-Ser system radical SAM maturase HxsB
MASGTAKVVRLSLDAERLAFFRFGRIGDRIILTNDAAQFHLLDEADFELLLAGGITSDHPEHRALTDKGFLRPGLDLDGLANRIRRKKSHVGQGPHLHIVLPTLRCNQTCRYCHASRTPIDAHDTDMTLETAKRVVDLALQTTSPVVNIEFQGGEPTLNFPVVKFVVEYSREKNRVEGKELTHSIVTNLTAMDTERADWLVDNDVMICTSLDGPEELHNWNRAWTGQRPKDGAAAGNAYKETLRWMGYIDQRYRDQEREPELWHVDALMTTTRKTFDHWKETIDLYVDQGLRSIHLRPLNPYGFALSTWENIGYTTVEYLAFYEKCLDYILELNRQGVEILEGSAAVLLAKMLTPDDPNFVDILSPCGAGTGQIAYNYDGRIFTCDEARMTAAMGDDRFAIGDVSNTGYTQVVQHPTVKAMALASLQDALPACDTCWNKPFCGVCPMHNYMMGGDLFGQRPNSPKCTEYMTISRLLLEKLDADTDGSTEKILRRWTVRRQRTLTRDCGI